MIRPRRRPARVLAAVVAVAALALGACTGDEPADPQARLAAAMEDTFSGSFAYRVSAEADREALADLGEQAGNAAVFLNTFALDGVVDGDAVTLEVRLLVDDPIVELRRYSDEELYGRFGLLDLPVELTGQTGLERDLLAIAEAADLPATVGDGIEALFAGTWVGVVGPFDPAALGGLVDPTARPSEDDTPLSLDDGLPNLLRTFLDVTAETGDDGIRRYDVELRLQDLLRGLAGLVGGLDVAGVDDAGLEEDLAALPETVPGSIETADGVVTSIRFDIAAASRALGNEVSGQLLLRLDLDDVGDAEAPPPPQDVTVVPSDDLAAGLVVLLEGAGG